MSRVARVTGSGAGTLLLLLMSAYSCYGRQLPARVAATDAKGSKAQASSTRIGFVKAFVIDDRLSVLRREPGLQSEVIRRLRLGHQVFIVSPSPKTGQPRFCRVAVTRRTRGWIHSAALAVQSRFGEDQRILTLIENAGDGLDRIGLCRLLVERFSSSRLVARALLLMGEESDRVADTLTQRARKRLAEVHVERGARLSDYYLSDPGLDRYSRLHIVFDFNESTAEFVYNGKAYRDIVTRFHDSDEAKLARQRLELASQKMARRE